MVSCSNSELLLNSIRINWPIDAKIVSQLCKYLDQGDEQIRESLNNSDPYTLPPSEVRAMSAVFALLPAESISYLLGVFMYACVVDSLEADVCVERVASFINANAEKTLRSIFNAKQLDCLLDYFSFRTQQNDRANTEELNRAVLSALCDTFTIKK